MKTLLIILSMVMLSIGASAQRKGGHYYHPRPRVIVVPSFSYGIGYGYGYPAFGYPYPGYPYGYVEPYQSRRMPYKLSLEIQSIKDDYQNRIKETRRNKSLSHSERRKEIRSLKVERDHEIINAERNFRFPERRNNNDHGSNNDSRDNNNFSFQQGTF